MRAFRRANEIRRLRHIIIAQSFPRLQSALFLVVAGGAGFLTTFGLLHAGLTSMALRFPLAVLVAYAVFLLCLRIWLGGAVRRHLRARRRSNATDSVRDAIIDALDGGVGLPWRGDEAASSSIQFGGGGGFGGGGSSGSFDGSVESTTIHARIPAPHVASGAGGRSSSVGDLSIDLDEGWLIVLPILAAVAAIAASLYVVWTAPTLFAELLLDGLLTAGAYRRWRGASAQYWAVGVVRRTWLPALATAIVFWGVGFGLHHVLPSAQSIGDVLRYLAHH